MEVFSGHLRNTENRWIIIWAPMSVWFGVINAIWHKVNI